MDKNTVIGFLLIFLVVIGFSYLNRPSKEQIEAQQRYMDSIAIVERQMAQSLQTAANESLEVVNSSDSAVADRFTALYGDFAVAAQGREEFITLENELLILKLSTKGGRVYSAQLKKYTNYEDKPLILFDDDESYFSTTLVTTNNRIINTSDLYFEAIDRNPLTTTFRLKAGDDAYLDFVYNLHPDDYMIDFDIVPHNLQNYISSQTGSLDLIWKQKIRQQEKGRKFEERYTQLFYKYLSDDVENLSESKDDSKAISNKLKWIGYKDQYFSSALIAKESFGASQLDSKYFKNGEYLKDYATSTSVDFDVRSNSPIGMSFYFGPNDYNLLKSYDKKFEGQDLQLEKLVYLGWSLFRSINKWLIIPIFDWLIGGVASVGLAIFLLTLIVKMLLFPLVYKSLMSSAKMRVMKPQIEAITAKHPGQENAMTRQQKTMELYRQVGINPMSGCVPMLIQMPILLALFWFFPSAIELRHQSFLWAKDLATYDAVIQWDTYIPFISDSFGNHLSLFCLLMSIVNIVYTKFNMEQAGTGQEQMPGMKVMMYIMPVFMMFFLNSYSSGLNYYYFISTLITVLQTMAFRYFLNERSLLEKLEANKKNPPKKKSRFMAKLEDAQRKQQAMLKEQQKKQGKRR
jgi:YidC/Oxa1 family membrane protein insertase